MTTSPSTTSTSGRCRRIDSRSEMLAWSMPTRPAWTPRSRSAGPRTVAHEPIDELALLHDRHGMDGREPGHAERALSTSPPEHSSTGSSDAPDEHAVQRRRLAGDELGPQRGEVADALVLPEDERVDARRPTMRLARPLDALAAQRREVDALLPVDREAALRVAHPGDLRARARRFLMRRSWCRAARRARRRRPTSPRARGHPRPRPGRTAPPRRRAAWARRRRGRATR